MRGNLLALLDALAIESEHYRVFCILQITWLT